VRSLFDRLAALGRPATRKRKRGVLTPGVSHPPNATPPTQRDISDTILWRRERGLEQKPEAVLFYCTNPAALAKLKAVVHLHELAVWEPMPHGVLVGGETKILDLVVRQWRESLSSDECSDVRGSLFESRLPSRDNVARALLHLEELDRIIARMSTRWFVRLLATDSVSVVFQPIVSIATGSCVACECLVRGEREGLPVDAETMLSNARLLGVSHELDHAAWRAAFKQGRGLSQDGMALFVNLTPSSALNPTFNIRAVKAMCRDSDIDISQLVFEVTEAEKVDDFDRLSRVMQEYRDEGAKIALDDLGSGYSSILRLADLRPDYVKLDQRLVHGAYGDQLRSVLLKAVTDAAHKLNIRVVAEGVESEEDLRFCIEIGADLAQGYFLAHPEKIAPTVSADALRVLEECSHMTNPVLL
jgi:EAL domain-containing protein (putative c-di-GMP-specific phosphodiesterase class I)